MKVFNLLLLVTCAFVTAFGQSKISQQIAADNPQFKLEITANRQVGNSMLWDFMNNTGKTAKVGDFVEIAIRKTNISDYEIDKTTHLSTTYGYLIEVLDGTGNLISHRKPSDSYLLKHSKPGHLIGTKDNVLQPGEYVIDFYHLSDLFDMSIPGTYTVQVSAYIMNDVESPVVKSNTITITVLPADNPSPAQK